MVAVTHVVEQSIEIERVTTLTTKRNAQINFLKKPGVTMQATVTISLNGHRGVLVAKLVVLESDQEQVFILAIGIVHTVMEVLPCYKAVM